MRDVPPSVRESILPPSDAECPFPEKTLCASENSTPLRLDSGYVSSRDHLGANTADEDTLEYRIVSICSPVNLTRHVFFEPAIAKENSTTVYDDFILGNWTHWFGSRENGGHTLAYERWAEEYGAFHTYDMMSWGYSSWQTSGGK